MLNKGSFPKKKSPFLFLFLNHNFCVCIHGNKNQTCVGVRILSFNLEVLLYLAQRLALRGIGIEMCFNGRNVFKTKQKV